MSDKGKLFKSVFLGSLCGIICAAVFTALAAALMLSTAPMPKDALNYISVAILSVGCMFGAFIAVKVNKFAALIVGVMTGAVIFLGVTIAGLSLSGGNMTFLTLIRLACCLVFGGVGGCLGIINRDRIKIK